MSDKKKECENTKKRNYNNKTNNNKTTRLRKTECNAIKNAAAVIKKANEENKKAVRGSRKSKVQ